VLDLIWLDSTMDVFYQRLCAPSASGRDNSLAGPDVGPGSRVWLRSAPRILEAHQLAPYRIHAFKLSKDLKFAERLTDAVGLYVDRPAHSVVLSVDEKSQIPALDRTQAGVIECQSSPLGEPHDHLSRLAFDPA